MQKEEAKADVIEQHIERGRQLIIEDSKRGIIKIMECGIYYCYTVDYRALLQIVYETDHIASNSIMSHLWIYRPLITIDHVSLSLEKNTESADLSVLRKFLRQVHMIVALCCHLVITCILLHIRLNYWKLWHVYLM